MFLDSTITIEELSGETPTEAWEVAIPDTTYPANIQPGGAEAMILSGGDFANVFTGYVHITVPVTVGSRIRSGAYSYTVKGIETHRTGPIPHLRLTLVGE